MLPYFPNELPLKKLNWESFVHLIGKANYEIARFEGILQAIINHLVLLYPLTTQEAALSSKIEGTIATIEEVYQYEAKVLKDISDKKHNDILEILNYRKALDFAVESLNTRPISLNLILDIHSMLLDSVRGMTKARRELRKTQNWLGRPGTKIENASYIPPSPERLMEAFDNLEKYIHCDELDTLVQLAIVHAQFEVIHPFLDGNGRVGRILIPLFLYEKKLLKSPVFYISEYLEANREIYYDRLNQISHNDNWDDWIIFFLTAIIEQSRSNTLKAKAILDLYEKMKGVVSSIVRSQFSIEGSGRRPDIIHFTELDNIIT
ncbi:MAG: Fic family protein [Nitrospirae bacterium]|nr:Fic family protein [Nitrospirota bacterium]